MKVLVRYIEVRMYIIIYKIAMKQNQDHLLVGGLLVDTYLWEKQFLGVSCFDRLY